MQVRHELRALCDSLQKPFAQYSGRKRTEPQTFQPRHRADRFHKLVQRHGVISRDFDTGKYYFPVTRCDKPLCLGNDVVRRTGAHAPAALRDNAIAAFTVAAVLYFDISAAFGKQQFAAVDMHFLIRRARKTANAIVQKPVIVDYCLDRAGFITASADKYNVFFAGYSFVDLRGASDDRHPAAFCGAADDLASGRSTFMVEMNEAASIINNLSQRSLILFDELGRGTSTYDGISIARAIVEYIHDTPDNMRPKTLFATHYHELNELEQSYPRIHNFHVSVKEIDGKVVFLRRLERGGSEHSFGIHVAKLAGMPSVIVNRANAILHRLETNRDAAGAVDMTGAESPKPLKEGGMQLSFFQLDDPVLSQIRDEIIGLDINNLSPLEALNKLNDIRSIITGKS